MVACVGVSCRWVLLQAGQAVFPVGAALLAVFTDLSVEREEWSRSSVCPCCLPAPAKDRGSTDAAGQGHLPWKGTKIPYR